MKYDEMINKISTNHELGELANKHIKTVLIDEIQNNLEAGVQSFDFEIFNLKYHLEREIEWLDNSFDKFKESWIVEKLQ